MSDEDDDGEEEEAEEVDVADFDAVGALYARSRVFPCVCFSASGTSACRFLLPLSSLLFIS